MSWFNLHGILEAIGWLAQNGYFLPLLLIGFFFGFLPPVIYYWWFKHNCPGCDAIYTAKRGGHLLGIFIGRDGKLRFYPVKTDGKTGKPLWGPLRNYSFVIKHDAIRKLKDLNAIMYLVDYVFPLKENMIVAVSKLRKSGFKTLLHLTELKRDPPYTDQDDVDTETGEVKVCSENIEPEQVYDYFVYDHSPAYIEEYATARETMILAQMKGLFKNTNLIMYALVFVMTIVGAVLAYKMLVGR